MINHSASEEAVVTLPRAADRYTLCAKTLRSAVMQLNGKDLTLSGAGILPDLLPVKEAAGIVKLAPLSCTFLVV